MKRPFELGRRYRVIALACLGLTALVAANANAEEAAPAAPPAAAAPTSGETAEPAPAPAETPAPTPMPAMAPAPAPEPSPPPAAVAEPAEPLKKDISPIKTAFGLRVAGRVQGGSDPKKMNDVSMDSIYLEARFAGSLNKYFGWQANFNGSGKPAGSSGTAAIEDLILKVDLMDELHVWAGRLLVPSDRSNFSGPFFMSPWNYPGVYSVGGMGAFIGPKTGAAGRDDGVVVWGDLMAGKAKYFLGAFNLDNVTQRPLYSGRVNIALLGEEPGFWGSSTYYGDKDIVAIGGGFQYQKDGSGTIDPATLNGTEDLKVFMGDLLAEKNLPGAGTVSLEGAYYHFDKGQPAKQAFYVLGSFLTDYVGVGKLQPLVRWQQTSAQNGGSKWTMLDAFVSYVIYGYNLKFAAGYQRTDLGNSVVGNAIQLAFQMQE
jgi:hypothetical protein